MWIHLRPLFRAALLLAVVTVFVALIAGWRPLASPAAEALALGAVGPALPAYGLPTTAL